MPFKLPDVDRCCGCVTDLKAAAAIIAVLGIVTSPTVSWAVVRHSYVIRVSCFITTSATRPDIVDINLNNILSFGFGAHAGLGPSCLSPPKLNKTTFRLTEGEQSTDFVRTTKYLGWIVLAADMILLFCSANLLIKIFKGASKQAAKFFMISASISMLFSFIYGMLYVSACISVGGAFPVFEFIFSLVDVTMWLYFLIVVNSYRDKTT
ncbi:uncharacterized protein LOC119190037 [Manduca sexta]|uniref:uncharacterized protein LOC119190037 n=1 Tax=Manduca sexta TaxID=7130 RepID=UPI00188E734E|nr:uncharacterized protein LOC119190037 [Manduca sexta]